MELREAAQSIISAAIRFTLPDEAVVRALKAHDFGERVYLVAIGKAAWQMTKASWDYLGEKIVRGIVITKYDHVKGEIPRIEMWEAGHPVPDENSCRATARAMELVSGLTPEDTVLFLVSGGGSALFESPLVPLDELEDITDQLLACGANIREINTIRKRLSAVKGGRFAEICLPARVYSVVLSDIIGDPLDMIASGPAYQDTSTAKEAREIAEKYRLTLSDEARALLDYELPQHIGNVESIITGSVRQLCHAASAESSRLGYEPHVLTASLTCTARDAGKVLASIAQYHAQTEVPLAFIMGGETIVKITGNGKGGRNQELALAAAPDIAGLPNVAIFSVGSDGTDGPTDAAGGYVDSQTANRLEQEGIKIEKVLMDNDAYHALERVNGLIITGPTGTNVNDLSVLLINPAGN